MNPRNESLCRQCEILRCELEEEKKKSSYYQNIAQQTGKKGLSEISKLSQIISEKEQAEAALLRVKAELEETNRQLKESIERANRLAYEAKAASIAKSRFLAAMSHEMRTPLNGIIGMVELALPLCITDEQKEYLKLLRQSAYRLMDLISNVLDLSVIEAGKLKLRKDPFSIDELLSDSFRILESQARKKGLRLNYSFPSNVSGILIGDSLKLNQILVNIVGNAIKFTSEGSIDILASVMRTGQSEAELHVSVADTGCGIAEQNLVSIFEPFLQEDSTSTRRFDGAGLGLSISKELVRLMGGSIDVKSEQGKGTLFSFTVKLEIAEEIVRSHYEDKMTAACSQQTLRIIVAEDEAVNRLFIVTSLRMMGHTVFEAKNGLETLELLEHEDGIELILLDISMPIMDGIEAMHSIREKERRSGEHKYIAALTAHSMKGDRERFLSEGADEYLSKPLDSSMILSIAEKALMALNTGMDSPQDNRME